MKKSKKITNIILINIIIFILISISIEAFSYYSTYELYKENMDLENQFFKKAGIKHHITLKYQLIKKFNYKEFKKDLRPVIKYNNNKRPLLFFGCSYTNTVGLKDNQLLYSKVAKLTKRTSYNRARGGEGAQLILYQLRRPDFYKEVPDAEFIIYTFIYDHLYRLNRYQLAPFNNLACLRYKYANRKLQEIDPSFLLMYSLFTTQKIQSYIEEQKYTNREECFELFYQIMAESLKLAKEHYPNAKFVILLYKDSAWPSPDRHLSKEQIKRLKSAGFIVLDAETLVGHELTSDQYRLADKDHPSEKAWNEVAPKLVKTLKL